MHSKELKLGVSANSFDQIAEIIRTTRTSEYNLSKMNKPERDSYYEFLKAAQKRLQRKEKYRGKKAFRKHVRTTE